jgi:DNA mismatch repair protein MutL
MDIFTRLALFHPHVSWVIKHQGKTMAQFPVTSDWEKRVRAVMGGELADHLLPMRHQRGSLVIDGFLAHPVQARLVSKQQYLFVNKRPVQDFLVTRAVKDAYAKHSQIGTQPSFVIRLSIAPDLVDVNVHPRKSEVRFADASGVFREVFFAVSESLKQFAPEAKSADPFVAYQGSGGGAYHHPEQSASLSLNFQQKIMNEATAFGDASAVADKQYFASDWLLIGQAHHSYILVQTGEGLIIIDQHAAAEKILFEKLLTSSGGVKTQALLVPLVIEVNALQQTLVHEQMPVLKEIGIEIESFGERTFRLTAVPQDLALVDAKILIAQLLEDLSQEGALSSMSLQQRRQALAKMVSCRGAIKFGDVLSREEQLRLLDDIRRYHVIACCHGRPAIFHLSKNHLNKQFGRPTT